MSPPPAGDIQLLLGAESPQLALTDYPSLQKNLECPSLAEVKLFGFLPNRLEGGQVNKQTLFPTAPRQIISYKRCSYRHMNDKVSKKTSMGGIPFFFSLISLLFLALINTSYLPSIFNEVWSQNSLFLICGLAVGAWISYAIITGRASVFLHELKHSIMSNLAGNRAKAMKFKKRSGHFTYEYTADTAKFNALIALAPYFLPIMTVVTIIFALVFFRDQHELAVATVALGFGADLVLNFRDVSPIQTDLTRITGGYTVGVLFVVSMNYVMASFLLIWALSGWPGIQSLFIHFYQIVAGVWAELLSANAGR